MTEYQDFEQERFTVKDATIRKTFIEGEPRFNKYILDVEGHDNIDTISMKLREYYSEVEPEEIEGVEFDAEEVEAEPVKAEDIPEVVLKIQEHLNNEEQLDIEATITVAKDGESSNWFINPEHFEGMKVYSSE